MKNNSIIVSQVAVMLLPIVLVFGMYVVVSGADGVGGGFQGGAILSTVFMLRYFIDPDAPYEKTMKIFKKIEKVIMITILMLALIVLGEDMRMQPNIGKLWLLLMNCLIAIKVACGLSILFFRFIFYEGQKHGE